MNNKLVKILLIFLIAALVAGIVGFAITSQLITEKDTRKIGYIMTGGKDENGWNGMNYKGISAVCDNYGIELILKEHVNENSGECPEAVSQLADEGAELIILSSYGYPNEVKELIDKYPGISFYGNSADYYSDNMTSYFGRMYQARYLAGIVAGMTTETNKIGYVAAMSNSEVNRGINAFALGVKRVNPDAEVIVVRTGLWDDEEKEKAAARTLIDSYNVDLLTYHQNQPYVIDVAEEEGIYSIGYNEARDGASEKYLTAAVWNWEKLYSDIVTDFLQGKANSKQHHWCGLETGAVGLSPYSPLVTQAARAEVDKAKSEILSGRDIFSGEIYDNTGVIRCENDEFISDTTLMNDFYWYVDGVIIHE